MNTSHLYMFMPKFQQMAIVSCDVIAGNWIRERIEPPGIFQMTDEEKRILLARLVRSTRYYYIHITATHDCVIIIQWNVING